MTLEAIAEQLPDYAKDLRLNLTSIPTTAGLTPQQLWGTVLSAAFACRNPALLRAMAIEAAQHLSPEAVTAAKAAAAIMGMNNIYYRFVHLVSNQDYGQLPAKLRMSILANPGVDKIDFELWALGVSAINGCGMCIDAHEKKALSEGVSTETVQNVVRIASILHAVAATLAAEQALAA
jgi:alkyl hydroperoxide reductase subunit D